MTEVGLGGKINKIVNKGISVGLGIGATLASSGPLAVWAALNQLVFSPISW